MQGVPNPKPIRSAGKRFSSFRSGKAASPERPYRSPDSA